MTNDITYSLENCIGKPLLKYRSKINFLNEEPTNPNYPIPSDTFNLIISNAVLEHVEGIEKFVSEVTRLLVSGGYFYGFIHNFYSLSGGHHLEWAYPDEQPSKKIPPWDHIRKNLFPSHVYLNRYRPKEYQEAFAKCLNIKLFEGRDVNHDSYEKEGEQYLTKQLASELADYSKELLLTRSWCIICQKA